MKVLVKENLGADFTANVISSCNQNGIQAISDYTHDEILFYDPQNHLYCRHSELIRNSGFDVFKMFKQGNENMRFDVMNPTEGDGFRDFATDWNALQRKDGSDVMKTKNCEMIRVEPNKIEEKTMRKTGESDKTGIVGNRKPRKEFKESGDAHAPGMDDLVADWYRDAFPTDSEMADEMEQVGSTFFDVWRALNLGKNVYSVLGDGADSIVRERVFEHLCELTGKKYRTLYNMWLKSADESSYLHDFKPIDSAYLDDGEGMDAIRGDDWYGDSDNYDTQERWERRAKRAKKMGKQVCWRCGSMFKPDGDEDMCPKCQKIEEQRMSRNNSKHENVSESDDPRDWSASEGEVEIMWTRDFPECGIESGDTDHFVVDYDLVLPNEYDMESNCLKEEVCNLIRKEYPDLDFDETDFDITNEREFWGDEASRNIYPYDESDGEFETMADIDDEKIWSDVGIDDNDNVVEGIPNWATCYIMYGDDSGLTQEDVAMVDKFVKDLEKDGLRLSHPISGSENEFNSYPAFGDACDTEDWSCETV